MDAQDHVRGLRGEDLSVVNTIAAVMLEPVGCLAEFHAEEFDTAARELYGAAADPSASGSLAYWRLLDLIDGNPAPGRVSHARLEELEVAAVERADLYEDVGPALEKLRAQGVSVHLVSSLSQQALARFVERFDLAGVFASVVARDDAAGPLDKPLRHAMTKAALEPARVAYLVDTAAALDMAQREGVCALLMINDYDEGRALAERRPAGGVVSLAELSDVLLLIEQRAGLHSSSRIPQKLFDLFEPG
jgi:phosphoglycolate phosphatase-like HAD superfamily hydrolase